MARKFLKCENKFHIYLLIPVQNILAICTFYIDSLLYFTVHSSVLSYGLYCFSCQLTLDTEIMSWQSQ